MQRAATAAAAGILLVAGIAVLRRRLRRREDQTPGGRSATPPTPRADDGDRDRDRTAAAADAAAVAASASPTSSPHWFAIVNNVSKRSNVGTMVRSAAAFGARAMLVVGRKKSTSFFGAFGSHKHVQILYFDRLTDACDYARGTGCTVWGVEIDSAARSVVGHPFRGPAAFLMGNEGHGLTASERAAVDALVYIPHHGNGTASLNVTVASSIIFHHFATWARYPERAFAGQKMVVDPPACKTGEGDLDAVDLRTRDRRAKAKAAALEAAAAAEGVAARMFDDAAGSTGDGDGGGGDY